MNGDQARGGRRSTGPEGFGDILKRVVRRDGLGRKQSSKKRTAEKVVAELLPAEQVVLVRVVSFRKGVLRLEVSAGTLLHELRSFREEELLTVLRAAGLQVAEIRWRLGDRG